MWPCVLAHSVTNLIQVPVALGGLSRSKSAALLFSPFVGLVHTVVVVGLALMLRRRRLRAASPTSGESVAPVEV